MACQAKQIPLIKPTRRGCRPICPPSNPARRVVDQPVHRATQRGGAADQPIRRATQRGKVAYQPARRANQLDGVADQPAHRAAHQDNSLLSGEHLYSKEEPTSTIETRRHDGTAPSHAQTVEVAPKGPYQPQCQICIPPLTSGTRQP